VRRTRTRTLAPALAALAITAALAAGCGSGGSGEPSAPSSAEPAAPTILPADFTNKVDNSWFPLPPGTTLTYTGTRDGKSARDVSTVTSQTRTVDGVSCTVVHDDLYLDGKLEERTTDWYAQDRAGNVWYFGEETAQLDENGQVTDTEGSWEAGKDGAQPGIFMPARPAVGQTYRQEYYKGHAEDHFQILDLAASVNVPAAAAKTALLTKEWTPLEPDVTDQKYYVRGIGTVLEESVRGAKEMLTLTSVTHQG
jgi:hypothetical protein